MTSSILFAGAKASMYLWYYCQVLPICHYTYNTLIKVTIIRLYKILQFN